MRRVGSNSLEIVVSRLEVFVHRTRGTGALGTELGLVVRE